MKTTKNPKMPKLPTGIPIYVDPIGLQEAEVSLNSPVKRPPSADTLAFGEHLRRVLESIGPGIRSEGRVPDDHVEGFDRRARRRGRGPLSPVSRRAAVVRQRPFWTSTRVLARTSASEP